MSTVYVVTVGSYSDYRIWGIFSNKKHAQRAAYPLKGEVETWEVDDSEPSQFPEGMTLYSVTWSEDGVVRVYDHGATYVDLPISDEIVRHDETYFRQTQEYSTKVWARDEDHARKIAQDRMAQYKAEHAGIA